jgi:hypothetical protein
MTDREPEYMRTFALAPHAPTQAVRDLARREGWEPLADVPRGHRKFRRLIWRLPGGEAHYAEDHLSGSRFLTFGANSAASAASLDALASLTAAAVPLQDEHGVLDRLEAAEEPSEIIAALLTLGDFVVVFGQSVADSLAPRLLPLVTRLAGHPVRQVRRAVLITVCSLVARWPDLAAPVLARQDEENELAGLMGVFAHVVGRPGGPGL